MKKNYFLLLALFFISLISVAQTIQHPALDYINLLEADVNNLNTSVYLNSIDSDIDSIGNLIVTGDFNGTIDFDPSSSDFILTANPSPPVGDHPFTYRSAFVAKYSPSGALIWAYKLGDDTNIVHVRALKVDKNNNIAITGLYKYDVDFDLLGTQAISSSPSVFKNFVAHYTKNADFNWVNEINAGTGGSSNMRDIDFKSNGNVVVAGTFNGQILFINASIVYPILNNSGPNNSFFAELNTSGTWISARHIQSAYNFSLDSIVIDSNDDIICNIREHSGPYLISRTVRRYFNIGVSAFFENIIKLEPSIDTSLVISAINVDSANNVYLGGYFKGTILKDGAIFLISSTADSHDAFLIKLDNSNNLTWVKTLVPINASEGYIQYLTINNLEINNTNQVIVTGSIRGRYDLGNGVSLKAVDPSFYNMYIAKFKSNSNIAWASIFQGNNISNSLNSNTLNLFNSDIYMYGTIKLITDFDLDQQDEVNVDIVYNDPDLFIVKYNDDSFGGLKNNEDIAPLFIINPTKVIDNAVITKLSEFKGLETLAVYDSFGFLMHTQQLEQNSKNTVVTLSNLKTGIYIIKVYNSYNEVMYTTKLIKE